MHIHIYIFIYLYIGSFTKQPDSTFTDDVMRYFDDLVSSF